MKKLLLLTLLFAASTEASYFCTGPVNNAIIHTSGYVGLRADKIFGDAHSRFMCNIETEWNNISPETCKIIAAKLMAKEASKMDIKIQYTDSLTCETQPHGTNSSRAHSIH